jgi:hypothetical protein
VYCLMHMSLGQGCHWNRVCSCHTLRQRSDRLVEKGYRRLRMHLNQRCSRIDCRHPTGSRSHYRLGKVRDQAIRVFVQADLELE